MAKIKPEEKSTVMAAIGLDHAVIMAAEADVHKMKKDAAPRIKDVVASFGPGPHKMPVPVKDDKTGDVQTVDFIVNFRKDGDTFSVSSVRADQIT